ncbi:MAG: phosphoadenosine phosphosulfate reductase family protein [Alkaliphilus sp.]
MWCQGCSRETINEICEICNKDTQEDVPTEVLWCKTCKVPVIKQVNAQDKYICPICEGKTEYMSADLRPVFPEERLLLEILLEKPLAYLNNTVWASNNRYYVDGKVEVITSSHYDYPIEKITQLLKKYKDQNDYACFNESVDRFIVANRERLNSIRDEAFDFIQKAAIKYPIECIVVSFSGGKDSTVVADLTTRALSTPSIVHIFGDTTLEFPLTIEYTKRFRTNNPKTIFKTAKNKEQDFFKVCEDIGPPARMLRWCCTMFKTGPITRVLNKLYRDRDILTFYGVRKSESVSRSKYNRIEDSADTIKIQKQTVASPVFYWKDADIWIYIFSEKVDFNDAYRLGYDRVGCWCCPNNNKRAEFLTKIYMADRFQKWRNFLVDFAKSIGKPDAEVYIDTGKWKARQGGNGVVAASDVKIKFSSCTAEENAIVYNLNKPVSQNFIELFYPFGKVAEGLGKKMINETVIIDKKTKVPILSIQPFSQGGYEYAVKVKTMNVDKHDDLQRMVGYQIRKFNACRKCLKCESVCKYGAITISGDSYRISDKKCTRCKMCVTAKYISGGCLMNKYLYTKTED